MKKKKVLLGTATAIVSAATAAFLYRRYKRNLAEMENAKEDVEETTEEELERFFEDSDDSDHIDICVAPNATKKEDDFKYEKKPLKSSCPQIDPNTFKKIEFDDNDTTLIKTETPEEAEIRKALEKLILELPDTNVTITGKKSARELYKERKERRQNKKADKKTETFLGMALNALREKTAEEIEEDIRILEEQQNKQYEEEGIEKESHGMSYVDLFKIIMDPIIKCHKKYKDNNSGTNDNNEESSKDSESLNAEEFNKILKDLSEDSSDNKEDSTLSANNEDKTLIEVTVSADTEPKSESTETMDEEPEMKETTKNKSKKNSKKASKKEVADKKKEKEEPVATEVAKEDVNE